MIKRFFAMLLAGILVTATLAVPSIHAQTTQSSARAAESAKADVARLGIGQQARVEIKLRDKRKLRGYVSAAAADSFTITDHKTGASQTLAYADVVTVKKPGGGLKTGTWIIIAGAAAAAVIVGLTVIKPVVCDGGAGC